MRTVGSILALVLLLLASFGFPVFAGSGNDGFGIFGNANADRPALLMSRWRPDAIGKAGGLPLLNVDRCGSTEYYCDDIGSPVCLYDTSEQDYWCAPRSKVYCDNPEGWDYWCSTDSYCCGTSSCCQ